MDCVNDAKTLVVENEQLKARIADLENRFGLVYPDYPEDVAAHCEKNVVLLKELQGEGVISAPDAINHTLIDGDNYAALKALQYGYKGRIDMMFIDPMYNIDAGKDEHNQFTYNDKLVDDSCGFKHGIWCRFMERRLRLARRILSEKGIIAITISDEEYAHLKCVCDKVFLSENCIATLIWRRKTGGGQQNALINVEHDYILLYAKNKAERERLGLNNPLISDERKKAYKESDSLGPYRLRPWMHSGTASSKEDRESMYYPIEAPDGTKVWPVTKEGKQRRWRGKEKTTKERMVANPPEIVILKNKDGVWQVMAKERCVGKDGQPRRGKHSSILYDLAYNSDGTNALKRFFPKAEKKMFNNPKPPQLITYLVNMLPEKDVIVLDFFAGSGTTAEGVMLLNATDGGTRRVILNNINDTGVCRGVTLPRFQQLAKEHGDNLRFYELTSVPYSGFDVDKVAVYNESLDTVKDACQCFTPEVSENKDCLVFSGNGIVKFYTSVYDIPSVEFGAVTCSFNQLGRARDGCRLAIPMEIIVSQDKE